MPVIPLTRYPGANKQKQKEPRKGNGGCRHWGNGRMASCLVSAGFVFARQQSSGDWLHTNVNLLNNTELYILKLVRKVNFMLCVFCHNFLKDMNHSMAYLKLIKC